MSLWYYLRVATGVYSEMKDEEGDNQGHALITGIYAPICLDAPYAGKNLSEL